YFKAYKGSLYVQIKLVDFVKLKGETSELIAAEIINVTSKYEIKIRLWPSQQTIETQTLVAYTDMEEKTCTP
ncbi:hypothetical protein KIL84_000707, partial [Mauremys mutica]